MFLAMNRFRVVKGREAAFETVWLERKSRLPEEPGFVAFHMLRGPEAADHTLYASHTVWESEQAFLDWTRSPAFRDAHKNAGGTQDLYLGPPDFEGFTAIQTLTKESA